MNFKKTDLKLKESFWTLNVLINDEAKKVNDVN